MSRNDNKILAKNEDTNKIVSDNLRFANIHFIAYTHLFIVMHELDMCMYTLYLYKIAKHMSELHIRIDVHKACACE